MELRPLHKPQTMLFYKIIIPLLLLSSSIRLSQPLDVDDVVLNILSRVDDVRDGGSATNKAKIAACTLAGTTGLTYCLADQLGDKALDLAIDKIRIPVIRNTLIKIKEIKGTITKEIDKVASKVSKAADKAVSKVIGKGNLKKLKKVRLKNVFKKAKKFFGGLGK